MCLQGCGGEENFKQSVLAAPAMLTEAWQERLGEELISSLMPTATAEVQIPGPSTPSP